MKPEIWPGFSGMSLGWMGDIFQSCGFSRAIMQFIYSCPGCTVHHSRLLHKLHRAEVFACFVHGWTPSV